MIACLLLLCFFALVFWLFAKWDTGYDEFYDDGDGEEYL